MTKQSYQNECSYCGKLLPSGFICPECNDTLYRTQQEEVYLNNIDEIVVAGLMETMGFQVDYGRDNRERS